MKVKQMYIKALLAADIKGFVNIPPSNFPQGTTQFITGSENPTGSKIYDLIHGEIIIAHISQ